MTTELVVTPATPSATLAIVGNPGAVPLMTPTAKSGTAPAVALIKGKLAPEAVPVLQLVPEFPLVKLPSAAS